MAEKQNSEGILEKVKKLALGSRFRGKLLIVGETSGTEKNGDAPQKKDKKKDKKPGGASSLEVFLSSGVDN